MRPEGITALQLSTVMNTISNVTSVFDAEWIPCARTGRSLYPDIEANATDRVVFERLWQAAGANTATPRPFLKFALSRVVGISAVRRAILPDGRISLGRFSHVKRAANDKLVFPERDRRTILIPVASPDLDGLLAALRNHSIESVDDWHPLDPR